MDLPLPPYAQLPAFLPKDELDSLVRWVLGAENKFTPAKIMSGDTSVVNSDRRIALTSRDLGPLEQPLRTRLFESLPGAYD